MHPQQLEAEKPLCTSDLNEVLFLMLCVVHSHNEGGAYVCHHNQPNTMRSGFVRWLRELGVGSRHLEMQLLLCLLLKGLHWF